MRLTSITFISFVPHGFCDLHTDQGLLRVDLIDAQDILAADRGGMPLMYFSSVLDLIIFPRQIRPLCSLHS